MPAHVRRAGPLLGLVLVEHPPAMNQGSGHDGGPKLVSIAAQRRVKTRPRLIRQAPMTTASSRRTTPDTPTNCPGSEAMDRLEVERLA